MVHDPSPLVWHEAHHVLDEDSGWEKRLAVRRLTAALKEAPEDGAEPSPHSLAWRRRQGPRTKGAARIAWSPRPRR